MGAGSWLPCLFIQHEQAEGAMAFGSEGWSLHSNLETATTDVMVRKTTRTRFIGLNSSRPV